MDILIFTFFFKDSDESSSSEEDPGKPLTYCSILSMHVQIYIKVLHVAYIQVYRLFRYNSTYVIFQKQNHLLPLAPLKTNGTLLSQCDLAATPPTLTFQ